MKEKLRTIYQNPIGRFGLILSLYSIVLTLSFWLAYQLRFDFFTGDSESHSSFRGQFFLLWPYILVVKLGVLAFFRQFSGLLSYFSTPDLIRLTSAIVVSSLCLAASRLLMDLESSLTPPRGVLLIDFVLSLGLMSGLRLGLRSIRERFFYVQTGKKLNSRLRRIAVFGGGDTGAQLIKELLLKRGLGMVPVAIFDDEKSKWGTRIHEVPVVGSPDLISEKAKDLNIEEVILAMPQATAKRMSEIVNLLNERHLKFATVPSLDQLTTGQVRISQLRPVQIEDLLKRPPINLDKEPIRQYIKGKVCLVTGAGGSIGSEICRQIMLYDPLRLILLEQSEVQMFQIEQELLEKGFMIITPVICDILDQNRLEAVFRKYSPEIVFHAAAHKHVPLMEAQPSEAIKNNSWGTSLLARLAMEYQVEKFVLISTDKAINPTNVMGASKRMAEIFIQALNDNNGGKTRFMAVRFGNVLGSSGSVIPTFRKQIASGGPVKVTHKDVTRYFMTIPEACSLVLQAGSIGEGGEIFVLDMGEPVRIVDLARQLIELSGLKPDEDIEIEFTGLRPGEKLFEELKHHGENMEDTHHPKIMKFISQPLQLEEAESMLTMLMEDIDTVEPNDLKARLKKAVPEYKPFLS